MNSPCVKKLIMVVLLSISYASVANAWPKVMYPPQTGLKTALADEMYVNGVPMQVHLFKTRLSVEQVLRFYRNRWADDFAESEYEQWQQISHYKGSYFITVQVKNADVIDNGFETLGRLNISSFDEHKKKKPVDFPMLADSKIINDIETLDKDKKGRTLLFLNRQSLDDNIAYYKSHFTKNNWTQVMGKRVGDTGHVSVFKKNQDEVTINIRSIAGGSSVLVNEVLEKNWFN